MISLAKQADEMLAAMTLEEKILQMKFNATGVEKVGLKSYNWWNEALHGAARAGTATVFPQSIGMAATFDEDLMLRVADIISTEVRAKYNEAQKQGDYMIYKGLTCWSPNVNIFRDPRWGRGHETYGEDPYLTARMGVQYIKGMQGDHPVYLKTAACAKHFAVHSGPESERHGFNAVVSQKDLHETYLPAFRACVQEAGVEAVMGAYNAVNGDPMCASRSFVQDLLRGNWGFKGHYVSDCGALADLHLYHKYTQTALESAAAAVKAGCDLNCGMIYGNLLQAVKQGLVTEEEIDTCVRRLLMTRLRLGTVKGQKTPWDNVPFEVNDCNAHDDAALNAACQSLVLLKNNGILPLDKAAVKTIGVIGPNADNIGALKGNYTGTFSRYETILTGISHYLGDQDRVLYAEGCHLYKDRVEACADPDDRISEALSVAKHADVVILCVGLDATLEGEEGDAFNADASGDKLDLLLPQPQRNLMEALARAGTPVVVVNLTGSSVNLSFVHEHFDAVIQGWYPGQRGGTAIARLLFGEYSPCGRLPVTFYKTADDLPDFSDYSMKNRTYRYTTAVVTYPFGYGLSYASFAYSDIGTARPSCAVGQDMEVSVSVTNTSHRAGAEIVQLYLRADNAPAGNPRYQLKRFAKVFLAPGEIRTVSFTLLPLDMTLVNGDGIAILEPGSFTVFIGGSQPDERSELLTGRPVAATRFTVEPSDVECPLIDTAI